MPLHLALEHRWHETKILLLLQLCPESAKQRGRGTPGDFPLSIAIEFHASNRVLETLLTLFPKACEHMNVYRMYLLRSAVRAKVHWQIIEKILDAYPGAAVEKDSSSQRVALHYAVSRSYPLSLIAKLIAANPQGVGTGDAHGLLPIHIAATRAGVLTLIRDQERTELAETPQVDRTKTSSNEQDPLNATAAASDDFESTNEGDPATIEARLDYDLKLFRMLVSRFPESVTALDKYGLSPINYLIENTQVLHQDQSNSGKIISHVGVSLLRCLCEQDEQRALPPSQRKLVRIGSEVPFDPKRSFQSAFVQLPVAPKINPLHHAIHCNRDADYIRVILDYDRSLAAATALDAHGQTTLHAAIARRMSTDCLLAILEAAPEAVRVRDQQNHLPIHFAVMYQAARIVAQRILAIFPEVTSLVDDPVHVTAAKEGMRCTDTTLPSLLPLPMESRPMSSALPSRLPTAAAAAVVATAAANTRTGDTFLVENDATTFTRRIVTEGGHCMLFHFALHYHVEPAILADILSYTMPYMPPTTEQLRARNADGSDRLDDHFRWQETHFYLWYDLVCHTYDCYPDTINVLFDDYQYTTRVIQLLCDFPNRHLPSRVTLSMATPRCHEQLISRLYYHQRFSWLPPRRDDHVDVVEEDLQTSVTLSNQKEMLSFHHPMATGSFGFRRQQPRKVMLKFSRQRASFDTEMVFRKNVLVQIEQRVDAEWMAMEAKARKGPSKRKSKKSTRKNAGQLDTTSTSQLEEDSATVSHYSRIQEQLDADRTEQRQRWKEQRVHSLLRRYFLEMIVAFDADHDAEYRAEVQRQRFVSDYPLLLVTAHASRTLHDILLHDHPLVTLQRAGYVSTSLDTSGGGTRRPLVLSWRQLGVFHTRIHDVLTDISEAVYFLHSLGYVHTNLNPMNVYEIRDYHKASGFRLVLGNFGSMKRAKEETPNQSQASHAVHVSQEIANLWSLSDVLDVRDDDFRDNRAYGYMAPEVARCYVMMASSDAASAATAAALQAVAVPVAVAHDRPENSEDRAAPVIRLDAKPSLDLWSLGAIAYHLGAGEPLLHPTFDHRVDAEQVQLLAQWNRTIQERRLARVGHHVWLRNLIQQWLSPDADLRPSVNYVLQRHPFFVAPEATQTPDVSTAITGLPLVPSPLAAVAEESIPPAATAPTDDETIDRLRYPPEKPLFDVYIAYNHCHFAYDTQQRQGLGRKRLKDEEIARSLRCDDQGHIEKLTQATVTYCGDIAVTGSQEFAASSSTNRKAVNQPIPAQVILDLSHRYKLSPWIDGQLPQSSIPAPAAAGEKQPQASSQRPHHPQSAEPKQNRPPAPATATKKSTTAAAVPSTRTALQQASADAERVLCDILRRQSQAKTGVIFLTRHGVNHPAELDERADPLSATTLNICRMLKASPLYLFLLEIVLMLELQARGWFENGIYLVVVGDNVGNAPDAPVFGPFFEHFVPPVDTADPIYVPPHATDPLDNVTMLRQVGNCFPLPHLVSTQSVHSLRLAAQTVLDLHGLGKALRYPAMSMKELFLNVLLPLPAVQFPVLHLLGPGHVAYQRIALDILQWTHPTLPWSRQLDSRGGRLSTAESRQRSSPTTARSRGQLRSSHSGAGQRRGQLLSRGRSGGSLVPSWDTTTHGGGSVRHAQDASAVGMTQAFERMLDMRVPSPQYHPQVSEHWFADREPVMPRSAIGSRAPSRGNVAGLRPVEEENMRPISPTHYDTVTNLVAQPIHSGGAHHGMVPSFRDAAQNAEVLILDPAASAGAASSSSLPGASPPAGSPSMPPKMKSKRISSFHSVSDTELAVPTTAATSASTATAAYFTEWTAEHQQQNVDMLRFCVEKTEAKENEVNNLKLEMALMEEQLRLQRLEILRLRNLVQVTSIRELPPTYVEDEDDPADEDQQHDHGEADEGAYADDGY
eukprot:gene6460-4648_t